ncbi:hypothetical protein ACJJTC_000717 [Scirpophaga incertulas]
MASGLIQFAFVLASGIINIMPNEVGAVENENTIRINIGVGRLAPEPRGLRAGIKLNNLEIFGILERKSEDLLLVSTQIASAVGITVTAQDVEFTTRLPTRDKNSELAKTVIIKFKTVQFRDSLLRAVRKKLLKKAARFLELT